MVNHGVFNNMAQVAEAHALVIKADAAKAVFIPHFHTVIAAGALGDNLLPDAQFVSSFSLAALIADTRSAGGASAPAAAARLFQHRNAQAAAL
jgi:hypothetical protein